MIDQTLDVSHLNIDLVLTNVAKDLFCIQDKVFQEEWTNQLLEGDKLLKRRDPVNDLVSL